MPTLTNVPQNQVGGTVQQFVDNGNLPVRVTPEPGGLTFTVNAGSSGGGGALGLTAPPIAGARSIKKVTKKRKKTTKKK